MASTVCINPPSPQQVQSASQKLIDELSRKSIPIAYTRAIAGAVVGNIIDGKMDPYDEGKVPIFTVLGALAGTRTGIRATGAVGSGIKTAVDATMPRQIKEWMQLDDLKRTQDYLDGYGATINANDVENVRGFKSAMRETTKALAAGRNGIEGLFASNWVRSQFAKLRDIAKNAPTANKISTFMKDLPNQIKQMKANVQLEYNAKNGVNAYDQFISGPGMEIGRRAMDKIMKMAGSNAVEIDDRRLMAEIQESIYRMMDTGMGETTFNRRDLSAGVRDVYANKPWTQAFDQELIADPKILEFVKTTRDFYSRVNDSYKELASSFIQRKADELAVLLRDKNADDSVHASVYKQTMRFVDDFRESGMSWNQYFKSLDGTDDYDAIATTLRAFADESPEHNRVVQLFHQIRDLQTKMNHQRELDRAYIPHTEDRQKMTELKRRMIANGEVRKEGDLSDANKELMTFEEHVERRIYDLNYGGDRKLYSEDNELLDFSVKNFSSAKRAKEDLKRILNTNRADGVIGIDEYRKALNDLDSFVKEGVRQSRDGAKKIFYIEAPEQYANVLEQINRGAFSNFVSKSRAKQFDVKKSSRMDFQRKLDLPYEFRQTDIYTINNSYANDVAPRLHSMKNGIYDEMDFRHQWITPIQRELGAATESIEAEKVANEIMGIYNTAMRVNNFKTPADLVSFEKQARFANAWRNMMAMMYQYGISFYNAFEHAVQTPTLTSWRSYLGTMGTFAFSPRVANRWAEAMLDYKVATNQLKTHGGSLQYFEDVGGLGPAQQLLERAAHFSSDFSVTKYIGQKSPIKFNVEDFGLFRIAFDGFMGGNMMSTAINARSSLVELRKLTQAYQAIQSLEAGAAQVVQVDGVRYNIGEVRRKLSMLGIDDTNINGYMDPRTQSFLNEFMATMDSGSRLTSEQLMENQKAFGYIQTVLHNTTENYQATNQFFRPEKAMQPTGRLLYQYSTYSYNQLLQNYQRRINFPIEEWSSALPENLKRENVAKLLYYYNTGNFDKLRGMGFTNEMIQTFPADAYSHIAKFFVGAVGVSALGHMSVDAFRDVIANPFKEDRDDRWRRMNRRATVNIFAPKNEQYTFGDLVDGQYSPDIMHLVQYAAATLMDSGMAGRYDAFFSSYERQSITDLTPLTRFINDGYKDVQQVFRGGVSELSDTMTDVAVRNAIRITPIVASSPFSETRSILQQYILNKDEGGRLRVDGQPIVPQLVIPNR